MTSNVRQCVCPDTAQSRESKMGEIELANLAGMIEAIAPWKTEVFICHKNLRAALPQHYFANRNILFWIFQNSSYCQKRGLWQLIAPVPATLIFALSPEHYSLHRSPQLLPYLLNWESELLAKSLDWGKLGNVATCCDAEGRSEAVVDTTLGIEPAEGSEGEGSVLDTGTDEVAAMSWKEAFRDKFQHTWLPSWIQERYIFYPWFTKIWLLRTRNSVKNLAIKEKSDGTRTMNFSLSSSLTKL